MRTENNKKYKEDAMTSPVVEQNKIKCPSCGQDIMTNPNAEGKRKESPSSADDIMAVPEKNTNYFAEDVMNSPAAEENKTKYGEDVMANPEIEKKKKECPVCQQDIMSAKSTD